jgi:hypothetical protein
LLRVSITLLSQLVKETLNNLSLTTSSRSYKHRRDVNLEELLHEVLRGNGISSGDGVVGDRLGGIDGGFNRVVSKLVPVFHLGVLDIYIVVENCSLGGELDDLPGFSPELVEGDSRLVSFHDFKSSSHAPDHGENEDVFESFNFLLGEHNFEELADSVDLRDNDIGDNVLEELTHLLVGLIKVLIEQSLKGFLALSVVRAVFNPRLNVRSPLGTIIIGNVKDTSTGDSGGGSVVKISNLEDELHVCLDSNTLVGGKGKKLVIIHDRVHRLNPVSIQISIKNDPLGVSVSFFGVITELAREETINPLTSLDVHNTVELVSVHDLGVDRYNRGLLAVELVGLGESLPGSRFTTSGRSHSEHTMANSQELTKLYDLEDIGLIGEHLKFFSSLVDDSFEDHVSLSDGVNSGEEISKESTEDF